MAKDFNGSTDYYQEDVAVVTAPPLSISAWYYIDTVGANDYNIMQIGDKDVSDNYFRLSAYQGDGVNAVIAVSSGTGGFQEARSSGGINNGVWEHAAGVWASNSSRAAYRNGGNKGTETTSITVNNADRTNISREGDSSPGDEFNGYLAEIGVWNVALTDDEIAILGDGYSPLFVRSESLVAYWPMIRGSIKDLIGNTNLSEFGTPSDVQHPRIIYPSYINTPTAGSPGASTAIKDIIGAGIIPFPR